MAKRAAMALDVKDSQSSITGLQVFYQGLLCNLLNPKAIMFLLAFFTLVVKPGNSLFFEMSYGFEIALIHMIWFATLSVIMTHQTVKTHLNRIQFYIVKAMGAVLVAFGIRIATLSQAVMLPTAILE